MKRTTSSLLLLGLTVSMALQAGCTAAPTNLTAIGPGPGNASRSDTFRLGAGDTLGTIIFAGSDTGEGSHFATVDEDDRPSR